MTQHDPSNPARDTSPSASSGPPSPGAKSPSNDPFHRDWNPADPAVAEKPKRLRRKILLVAVGVPAALVLHILWATWSAQGDYAPSPIAPHSQQRLAMTPWPKASYRRLPQGEYYYWSWFGQIELLNKPEASLGWTFSWRHRLAMRHVDGPYYSLAPSRLDSGNLFGLVPDTIERYPMGALDALSRAIDGGSSAEALEEARKVAAEFPDRITPKYWVAALTAIAGDLDASRKLLAQEREAFEASPKFQQKTLAELLENDIAAMAPEEVARRREFEAWVPPRPYDPGRLYRPEGEPTTFSYEEWEAWFEGFDVERPVLIPSFRFETGSDYQSRGGLFPALVVRAPLYAMDGRREQAVRLLEKAWRLNEESRAAPLMRGLDTLTMMICRQLELLTIHASLTPAEMESDWARLESMAKDRPEFTLMGAAKRMNPDFAGPFPKKEFLAALTPPEDFRDSDYQAQWLAGAMIDEARFQLFREALRVRHYRAVHGSWPAIDPDGSATGLELATAGPPILDPCADPPRPFRAELVGDGFRLKSFGPDEVDDKCGHVAGTADYMDFTGDLFIDLAPEPRYDFPDEPGHVYADADELRRRYPDGFPRHEPFAGGGPASLGFSTPSIIVSWDPAAGKLYAWTPNQYVSSSSLGVTAGFFATALPGPVYDPRSGVSSKGAAVVELKFADPGGLRPPFRLPKFVKGLPTSPP